MAASGSRVGEDKGAAFVRPRRANDPRRKLPAPDFANPSRTPYPLVHFGPYRKSLYLILCATSVFSVSLWLMQYLTTETQRTQRLHRDKIKRSRRRCR